MNGETPGRKMLIFQFLMILGAAAFGVAGSWAFIHHLADHQFKGGVLSWVGSILAVGATLSLLSAAVTAGKLIKSTGSDRSDKRT